MNKTRHIIITTLILLGLFTACVSSGPVSEPDGDAEVSTSAPAEETSIEDAGTTEADTVTKDAAAQTANAFPVTLEHKFGSTTIAASPERVAALGYTDQDPILALGVKPVAIRYFFGDETTQIWPWAQAALGDTAPPTVLNMPHGKLNFETITALQPDLIIAVSAGITDEEYQTLAQIAPTVAQSDAYVDFGVPWQEQTKLIGRALGKESLAQELVANIEARFAQALAAYPEFAGASVAIGATAGEGQFYFSGPEHERQRFLTSLGFTLPDDLTEIAGDSFFGAISGERLDLLDTDVLIWTVYSDEEQANIEQNPLYRQLSVAKEGGDIFLDISGEGDLVGPALVYSSVLSLPVVFDELVPQLVEALS
ncbi:MAG: iron-siderophore ABC transporter substrate-binding protein [Chloroflexales bacterium]|nr:iron-siderophore ABC transporter substrate-binding protein [Chloroflexales bacterium]